MSGCGVWQIYSYKANEKVIFDYRLIGIFIEFRNSKFEHANNVFVANRLHVNFSN